MKRAEEKAKENALKTEERSKRKTTNKKRAEPTTLSVLSRANSCSENNEQARKKANTVLSRSEDLNCGECCVCFDTYDEDVALETGRDWVECACQRWLHKECAEDCVIDPNDQERLCPFCLDVFEYLACHVFSEVKYTLFHVSRFVVCCAVWCLCIPCQWSNCIVLNKTLT